MVDVNPLALLLSGVVFMIIGSLWYSPLLFVKPWMKLAAIHSLGGEGKNRFMIALVVSFLSSLVMAYMLNMYLRLSGVSTVMDGMMHGAYMWLGFTAPISLVNIMYEGRSLKLFLINAGYFLVSLVLMGAILVALR